MEQQYISDNDKEKLFQMLSKKQLHSKHLACSVFYFVQHQYETKQDHEFNFKIIFKKEN